MLFVKAGATVADFPLKREGLERERERERERFALYKESLKGVWILCSIRQALVPIAATIPPQHVPKPWTHHHRLTAITLPKHMKITGWLIGGALDYHIGTENFIQGKKTQSKVYLRHVTQNLIRATGKKKEKKRKPI